MVEWASIALSALAVPIGCRVLWGTGELSEDPHLKNQIERENDPDTSLGFTCHVRVLALWQGTALFASIFSIVHALMPSDSSAIALYLWVHVAFEQSVVHIWQRSVSAIHKTPLSPPWWVYTSRLLVFSWCAAFALLLDILTLSLVNMLGSPAAGGEVWLIVSEVLAAVLVVGCLLGCALVWRHNLEPILFFAFATLVLFLLLLLSQRSLASVSDGRLSLALGLLTALSCVAAVIDALAVSHTPWKQGALASALGLSVISALFAGLASNARTSVGLAFVGIIDTLAATLALLITRRDANAYSQECYHTTLADVGVVVLRPRYSIGGEEVVEDPAVLQTARAIAGDMDGKM